MNGSISSSAASPQSPAQAESPPERQRYHLTGPSREYDPTVQAIRPDLADIAEAHHHFAPHYAKPLAFVVTRPTRLRAVPGTDDVVAELAEGDVVMVLDVTAECCWGYDAARHRVGYVPRADVRPQELRPDDGCS